MLTEQGGLQGLVVMQGILSFSNLSFFNEDFSLHFPYSPLMTSQGNNITMVTWKIITRLDWSAHWGTPARIWGICFPVSTEPWDEKMKSLGLLCSMMEGREGWRTLLEEGAVLVTYLSLDAAQMWTSDYVGDFTHVIAFNSSLTGSLPGYDREAQALQFYPLSKALPF